MTFSLDCSPFTDNVIQKVKWHFNYVSSTQMNDNLEKLEELSSSRQWFSPWKTQMWLTG